MVSADCTPASSGADHSASSLYSNVVEFRPFVYYTAVVRCGRAEVHSTPIASHSVACDSCRSIAVRVHVGMGACCVHACLLFVGCCMLSAACSPLHVVRCMLSFLACCPLHVVRCTLHFVCCVLSFACCQAAADALHALTTAVCAELSAPPPIVRDTCLLVRSALADEVCAAKP